MATQNPTNKDYAEKSNSGDVLKKNLDRFYASWRYAQSTYHLKWEQCWKLYNNRRVHRNYKGTANTFVPMTFGAIEVMVAALGNGRPAFDYDPEYPTQQAGTDVLNALIEEYGDRDQWDIKFVEMIRQMFITGNAAGYLYWNIDHPSLVHFSIRDAIIDPNLTSPMQLLNGEGYAGRRYLTTLDRLKEFEVVDADPKSKTYGQMKKRFKNLDQVKQQPSGTSVDKTTDKERKDMFMGTTALDPTVKMIEVLEIWDKDRKVSIANRQVIIEDEVNPTKQILIERKDPNPKGIIPFVFFRDYTDVSLFYGKGEIEPIKQHQEMLNDITNQNLDAITLQLSPQIELDPSQVSWINRVDNTPGRVYPFKAGTINWRVPPTIPANAFTERTNIKAEIREATAIDQIAKGVSDNQAQTATEVRATMNNAGQRMDIKAMQLEKDGFYQFGYILFKLIQLYVRKPLLVKVATSTGTDLKVFNPEDFMGNYRPRVQLDINQKAQKQEQQQKAMQAYQMIIQDPTNNLVAAKKILYPKMLDLEPQEIEEIITPAGGAGEPDQDDQAAQAGLQPGMPQQGGQPGAIPPVPEPGAPGQAVPGGAQQQGQEQGEPPEHPAVKLMDTLQIKFTDLPEDVKSEVIQQLFGVTPQMPSPVQQQIDLKQQAQDHAGVVADNKTKMDVVKHLTGRQDKALEVAQAAAEAEAAQQQQAQQPAPQGTANGQ